MTELTITPKVADKTAKIKGTIAAGEHVAVTIKGGAEWLGTDNGANLTLRVLDMVTGRTLAVFPCWTADNTDDWPDGVTAPDAWDEAEADANDLFCKLNLNTLQMVAAARHMLHVPVMFVLGDTDDPRTLYFKDRYVVEYWPERIGEDTPYDLNGWPKRIDDWTELVEGWTARLNGMKLSATRENNPASGRPYVEITLNDGTAESDTMVKVFDGEVSAQDLEDAVGDLEEAIAQKQDALTFDDAPTAGSANPVKSGGVKTAIDGVAGNLTSHAADTEVHVTASQKSAWNAKYDKPSGGIPATDLSAAVNASLALANSAVQDVSGKADKSDTYTIAGTNEAISNAIANLLDSAPDAFDTLKEIADWITDDATGAAKMTADIAGLQNNKVDKVAGKGLSKNDFTDAAVAKLEGIEANANNYVLPVATASTLGGVKQGIGCIINADGTIDMNGGGVTAKISWADLKAVRDAGLLVPGQTYRITDYTATVANDIYSRAAEGTGHPFDIIVTADAPDRLNEEARAVQHVGDTYFNGCNLAAWKVWYCLDNDTSRFAWADATNGKGVVYRLIDEWLNDCPYDFKGIQYYAHGDTDNVWRYTFDSGDSSGNTDCSLHGGNSNKKVVGNTIGARIRYSAPPSSSPGKAYLNQIVFKGVGCYGNIFGRDCYGNTIGSNCHNNTFGNNCYYDTFEDYCVYNTIGDYCCYIIFGRSYIRYVTVEAGNRSINLSPTDSFTAYYQNVTIKSGTNTTNYVKTISDPNVEQTFHTTYQPAGSQTISV